MSTKTYKQIEKEINKTKKEKEEQIEKLKKEKNDFIRSQTFTGEELLRMRSIIEQSDKLHNPRLEGVLEQIIKKR